MVVLDFIGILVGFILTIVLFSYLLKETVIYRWALALLVGGGLGYAMGLTWQLILRDWIFRTLSNQPASQELILLFVVPMLLGALLILKGFSPTKSLGKLAVLGNIPLAMLVGVGAALAVTGGLLGTLIPQILATGNALNFDNQLPGFIQGIITIIGVITSLSVFAVQIPKANEEDVPDDDDEKPNSLRHGMQQIGQVFIAVALGVTFGRAVSSALTVMVIRLSALLDIIQSVQGG